MKKPSQIICESSIKNTQQRWFNCWSNRNQKTKKIQSLAESLSDKGIPVLFMDVKGNLSGLAKPNVEHPKIYEYNKMIGFSNEVKKISC